MTTCKAQSVMDIFDECKKNNLYDGYAVFYTLPGIVWAKISNGGFVWRKADDEPAFEDILKARLFNTECEIHLWKDEDSEGLTRRCKKFDDLKSPTIEKKWLLLGKAVKSENAFSLMEEDKGGIGWIPLELKKGEYANIRVIHEMGYLGEHNQNATIQDFLFAGLGVYEEDEK